MAIKISALYITKNEEHNLARSLDSLQQAVDEIIVVDTGSTDGTVAVAKRYGATVYHYEWQDDFAAPRNYALDKATGDWIIFLDADEYFTSESTDLLRPTINEAHGDAITVTFVNIDEDGQNEFTRDIILRLWQAKPNRRYVGKIHEHVRDGDQVLQNIEHVPQIILNHTGYSTKYQQQKAKRNLQFLMKELEAGRQTSLFDRYLAECYFALKDYELAFHYAVQAVHNEPPTVDSKYEIYHITKFTMRYLEKTLDEQCKMLETIEMRAKQLQCNPPAIKDKTTWQFLQQWAWEIGAIRAYLFASMILVNDYQWEVDDIANTLSNFQNKDLASSKEYLINKINNNVKYLVVALLKQNKADVNELWWQILPAKYQPIIKAYHGIENELTEYNWSDYRELWQNIKLLIANDSTVILQYALLVKNFTCDKQLAMADELFAEEHFDIAMLLYQDIPNDKINDLAKFWHNVAICLYNLKHPETANALAKAAEFIENNDILSYQTWWKQKMGGESA